MFYNTETAILLELLQMPDTSSLLSAEQKQLLCPIKKNMVAKAGCIRKCG
jgi:hypothetical protein